jgi:aldehyde:ferredoxin oxidoreductase
VDFYQGRVLRVDLASGTVAVDPLNMEWAEMYVGGKGLLFRYMLEEVPPGIDPLSPENPLFVATGPFAGTCASTCSRAVVGGKSPATGLLLDSYVGGTFAPELKFAGYDMLIVKGRAPAPVVILVRDDEVSIVPAGDYWGMKTSEIEAALRADFDPRMSALSIGPAGENLVPWACVSNDQYHKAGRGGTGVLMGAKNLKAIAVRGSGAVTVGDARAFLADMERMNSQYVLTEDNLWVHEEGTPIVVDLTNGAGAIPTRNWSAGHFEGGDKINSESFQKLRVKKRACFQCPLACRNFHRVPGAEGEGPEYETITLCGANCGVDDPEAIVRFNGECDEWGLDTVSTGNIVGLAMDMTERGIHDFGVRFGDGEGYLRVPEQMATGTGPCAELAAGARAIAAKYGCPELAMEVKNLELPGYDPRGSFGMSIAYATSDRGGCHQRAYPIADEIITATVPADTMVGKAKYNIDYQNHYAIKYSGIWCDFLAVDYAQMTQLMRHVWKREVTVEELERAGERIWNLGRLFNLREGVEPDGIPIKLRDEPFTDGPSAGKAIGAHDFADALREYYDLRGWDDRGVPTEAKLRELGIDVPLPAVPS